MNEGCAEMNFQYLTSKWIATVSSIWIQCSTGSSYTFSIYSSALKSTQNYDQSTLDTVSVFKDIGANAGILSGLLYSAVTPSNRRPRVKFLNGPWVVLVAGSVQCFVGYFFMWAAVSGMIQRPPVPVMCLFMFLAAHAQTFFNTANVVTGLYNFGQYGGTIVGIMKGFLGLSGAILIQVYNTLCKGEPSTYLLMLSLLPTLLSLSLICMVRIERSISVNEKKHLNGFSAVALIVAAYLMVIIILQNIVDFPFWVRILTFIILLGLLALPLGIGINARREELNRSFVSLSDEQSSLMDSSEPMASSKYPNAESSGKYHELPTDEGRKMDDISNKMPTDEEGLNILQAMRSGNFWLLSLAMVCGMGSGLATINNMSQIGQSLGYGTVEINTFVSLWSIWNFLGRFGAGFMSDYLLHTAGWSRPLLMAITLATMSIGHLIIASGISGTLYVGSILVGICYGSQWSLMPTITSEIFGMEHMGTIFNTIAVASPVGSYIFSVRVIGYIYDKKASGPDNTCSGTHCFMLSFIVMASVALFGCFVAIVLFFRTKRLYQLIVLRRFKKSPRQ